ncbi:MAG: DUF5330 domain-containing protein [Rhizobiaceae bacterium]
MFDQILHKFSQRLEVAFNRSWVNAVHEFNGADLTGTFSIMLRLVFWICLLIMFIPTTNDGTDLSNQQLSTQETLAAANSVYGDFAQFCDRNPQTCDTGRYYVAQFKEKARTGVNMVMAYLDEGRQSTNPVKNIDQVTTSSISK